MKKTFASFLLFVALVAVSAGVRYGIENINSDMAFTLSCFYGAVAFMFFSKIQRIINDTL
ncbi:hypothetical protein IAQ67_16010 [Paenibacillus peoriae]|uniref:Uncharacterized protein n=1 Tax=Paenibacillus peoriae TaxID=59893 RepID=A0A7H0Y2U0_9BACL|nr:hypothetical protein [Paenibacillus peoriae]QNR65398.1 hypothetical protein IAQ67_16010 [Paenibacillus peoriae]